MDFYKEEDIFHLELEVEEVLENILNNNIYWETHIFKCLNRKNIKIKQPKYYNKKNPYQFTFQSLSHYLTVFKLPDISFIETILLIPKFIATDNYFLNNLYLTEKKLLVFYLTPIKIYLSNLSNDEVIKNINFNLMISQDRIIWKEHFYTKFQNLFYTLYILHEQIKFQKPNQIYKFVDSIDKLTNKEIQEMDDLHDFFVLKHPINKI